MLLTKYFKSVIIRTHHKDKHWQTYLFLATLRVLLVFSPQFGYIHPDEFLQSVEVIAGDKFQLEHKRTWEFNSTSPIRSVALQYFVFRIPYNLLEFLSIYTNYYLKINLLTSYFLLVYPRLVICILSFLNDWSLYKICESYSLRYEIRLLALGSSFIMLVFGTRTFSNTIEMTLCSVLMYLVADCMIHSNTVIYKSEFLQKKYQTASSIGEKVKLYKLKAALPAHSYNKAVLMSTLCVIGVFNRPTFLVFGGPIVFFWLLRGLGTKTVSFVDFNLRITLFCICAVPAILLFILIDSLYYHYLTLGEIHMLDIGINNFVFTPWNFVKYNIDPEKTAQHGVHPKYLHLLVNMPLLYNILGISAIFSFGLLLFRFLKGEYRHLPRTQSIVGLMTASIFVPLAIFSLINHQEPRFLLPLTLPIILLHAPKLITGFCTSYPFVTENKILRLIYNKVLCTKASSKYLLKTWYIINIALTIFFGYIHQGGVFQLAQHFSGIMEAKPNAVHIHLATSHIYGVPLTFVNIPSTSILRVNRETKQKYRRSKEFFLYEYQDTEMDVLVRKLKLILEVYEMKAANKGQKYRLYLAIPTSLGDDFSDAFYKLNSTLVSYKQVKVFFPHFSTEAMPKLWGRHPCDLDSNEDDLIGTCDASEFTNYFSVSYVIKQFSSVIHQFGLALYRLEIRKKRN